MVILPVLYSTPYFVWLETGLHTEVAFLPVPFVNVVSTLLVVVVLMMRKQLTVDQLVKYVLALVCSFPCCLFPVAKYSFIEMDTVAYIYIYRKTARIYTNIYICVYA